MGYMSGTVKKMPEDGKDGVIRGDSELGDIFFPIEELKTIKGKGKRKEPFIKGSRVTFKLDKKRKAYAIENTLL